MWILFDLTCISFLAALLLTPLVRSLSVRWGVVDRPDGKRKIHGHPIPRMGGVAVAAAYTLALAFILFAPYRNVEIDIPKAIRGAMALTPPALLIFLTGLLDDIVGLKPWQKLSAQVVAALGAYYNGFGVYLLHGHSLETYVSVAVTVLWIVGCTNALNLIDGMDGLASGVGFFAATTTLLAALTHHNVELALVTAPLAGALLGFLRYNFNPASIFLGDCGSLTVGFLLGCYGALWSHKSATILGMTAPLMALAIPLLDTGLSVVRRFLRSQPVFGADRGHIHHRLMEHGLTPRRAVLLLYGVCGLAAALSLLQDLAHQHFGGLIIILFCAAAWIGVQHLGYAEFGIAGRLVFRGALRRIIDVQVRLQQFERSLHAARGIEEKWHIILEGCREFGFRGARMKIGDRIYEDIAPPSGTGAVWQLRIPLPDGQYVNFYRDLQTDMHPIALNGFAEIVQKGLFTGEETPAEQPQAQEEPKDAESGARSPA